MAQARISSYANATPLEFTPVLQPTVSTLDGKVSWTWDNDTGTLETVLPDGGKLYLLANDVETLYTLLQSVAARLATCSKELTRRLNAGDTSVSAQEGSVIYLQSRYAYEQE